MTPSAIPLRAAVAAGGWIAVSGQLGVLDGRLADGARAQATQALANLRSVLAAHDASVEDVVKVNVFLVTMEHYNLLNEVYGDVFGGDSPPARTVVAVAELPFGALLEVEAWAYRPAH